MTNETKTIRLLTIGNSFADNATRYLGEIAAAAGDELLYTGANLPGGPLSVHWEGVVAHEKKCENGCLYNDRSLTDLLSSEPWDVVTLQQFSGESHAEGSYRPYAEKLHALIQKLSPSATILLHQTWAYRADDTEQITHEYSQENMHTDIRNAYHTIADELNVGIIPVGDAFAAARNHPEWNFVPDAKFDPKTAEYPNRPQDRHSLCAGFAWKEWLELPEMHLDTHHASEAGQYLAAAVFFEMLFGKSSYGNTFRPAEVPAEEVLFLQEIAHETVCSAQRLHP